MRVSSASRSSDTLSSSSSSSSSLTIPALSALLLAFPSLASAVTFDCSAVAASGKHFDLSPLKGVHQVQWLPPPDTFHQIQDNFTFFLDICKPLHDAPKMGCHTGARICAVDEIVDLNTHNITKEARDIAGTFANWNHRFIDPKISLLRNSGSNSDVGREGVRTELHGGKFGSLDQMAILEFVCDKERTGLEEGKGEDNAGDDKDEDGGNGDDKKENGDKKDENENKKATLNTRQDNKNDKCEDSDKSLRFCGYNVEDQGKKDHKAGVLRLEWRTKYACEKVEDDGSGSSHWGFFTWFIIIFFLATAAYLIFGSWLNYNRYGARGWDLLPHGDTIRDIPYIMKDLGRRVVNTVQGGGSRGGYSAV